ncbi:MAG: GGDEF domain-containing protein [Alphaproteobacteria bacterium HGW-Alphaproteobacteria-15]|nr:MAG: GGDEF domain-containing protein [Alphaproteobacteria bacterium HGW-Alphaproteobacteria-15]
MILRFYLATRFLFPSSLRMRMFTVCFIGTHVPLLAFVGWQFWQGVVDWPTLAIILAATLAGTAITLIAIDALLAPIRAATAAVEKLERDQLAALKQVRGSDMLGDLIAGVDRAAEATRARIATLDSVAHRDTLTGLWNRRGFLTQVSTVSEGSLALIDLDRFKAFNDTHGHAAGDQVLRDFADFLQRGVRKNDIVARWGGEEFVALFPDTDEQKAAAILARMLRRLAAGAVEGPEATPVSFSGGVVDLERETVEEAMHRADAALYAAKRGGREQLRVGAAHVMVGAS